MGRDLRSDVRRCPLLKWVMVLLCSAVTLNPPLVCGSTKTVVPPAAVVAPMPVRPVMAAPRPLLMTPARGALIAPPHRAILLQPEWAGSVAERVRLDPSFPASESADAIAERMPYLSQSSSRLASFHAGAGQINLDWKHGTKLGASWEFEHSFAQPSIELTTSGTRKVYLSVNLHW